MKNFIIFYLAYIIISIFTQDLNAQTQQWRLVWNKNAVLDSVEYYIVHRRVGANPTTTDVVAQVPYPADVNTDTVFYIDSNIAPGVHYYYSVIAVDSSARRSNFSQSVNAAIPDITFNQLTLSVDTLQVTDTITVSLNSLSYVNDADDGFIVSWAVQGGTQMNAQIISNNRVRFFTPADPDLQESFQFTVVDPDSFFDTQNVTVRLAALVNQPPQINSSAVLSVQAGQVYEYVVTASDGNGDALTFVLTEGPDYLSLTQLNNNSARVTGTPQESDVGTSTVRITVTDVRGGSDEQVYPLSVSSAIANNQNPTINSAPQISVQVGQTYNYTVTATDADGDTLTFSLIEAPQFLSITPLSITSARLSGIPAPAFVGVHPVRIAVVDRHGGSDTQSFNLTVVAAPGPQNVISSISLSTYASSIIRLAWETTEGTRDYLEYGLTPAYGQETETDQELGTFHERTITGLLADTEYHFRIVSARSNGTLVYSADSTFITESGENVDVFPIPYVASEETVNHITFVNVPQSSTIVIYNLLAEPVFRIDDVTHIFNWNVQNQAGKDVNSGTYIYHIRDRNNNRLASGKIIVIR